MLRDSKTHQAATEIESQKIRDLLNSFQSKSIKVSPFTSRGFISDLKCKFILNRLVQSRERSDMQLPQHIPG